MSTVETPQADSDAETGQVDSLALTQRLSREGRWQEVQPVRDHMMAECRLKGMSKEAARAWTYSEIERLYPPLDKGDSTSALDGSGEQFHTRTRESNLQGLGEIPADWPELPSNAALPAELSWVQSERLRIVEERPSGATVVHLDRAGSPAPSWAALGWLETSIRSYAKYVDICAKGLGSQELESDLAKRERRSIEDVRRLLAEMIDQ